MSKDAVIRRGQAADRLLKDEAARKAFDTVIEDLQAEWLRTRPDDTATREGCYRMVHAVQLVVAKLEAWRASGVMEEHAAEQQARDARGEASFH
jgi:hypothetical protein